MSQTYGINYTTRQKLVNLNYKINKVIVKITKSMYLGQAVEMIFNPTTAIALKFINLWHNLVISYISNGVCGCWLTWTPLSSA